MTNKRIKISTLLKGIILTCLILLGQIFSVDAQQLAFPTAEGYARYTVGGRGGDVYTVTNLTDDNDNPAEGSLRFGINNQDGPRTIVFAVSGDIILDNILKIKNTSKQNNDYLTIAGQTAPGDGICIRDHGLEIRDSRDLIIRYIRIRVGDQNKDSCGEDCINMIKMKNVILDHVSLSWSIDGIIDTRDCGLTTLQWCFLSEPLHRSIHYRGIGHAFMGSLRESTDNTTIHHCLLASSWERHITMSGEHYNLSVDFRNNLIYNSGLSTNIGGSNNNLINNYFAEGPNSNLDGPIHIKTKGKFCKAFVSGNHFEWSSAYNNDNYEAIDFNGEICGKYTCFTLPEIKLPATTVTGDDVPVTETPQKAYESVLENAGCSHVRDAADIRLIERVRDATHVIIDSQDDVGGWPTLNSTTAPTDSDSDGMPDAWEIENGLDENDPSDRNADKDGDGYTNLEEYLNELAGEQDSDNPVDP